MATLSDQGFLEFDGLRLEYRMAGPRPHQAPTLLLLHEGLGSAGMWGDFLEKLSAATGCGVFAWSRVGYGHSSPAKLPRTLDFMHVEALTRIADRHYLIERGRVVWSGTSAELAAAPQIQHQYLGI